MLLRGILLHTVRILKQISILICFHGQILKVREMVMLKKKKISWLYTHLKEISSLSHSVAFLYFFSLNAEKGFLISSCCSLEFCIQMGISFLSPLLSASLLFIAICKASSDRNFAILHFFFLGMVLIPVSCTMSRTLVHSSSGTLSDLVP